MPPIFLQEEIEKPKAAQVGKQATGQFA